MTHLERAYFWPKLRENVVGSVQTCLICQQDKVEPNHQIGLLEALPIPSCLWESISVDSITSLPEVDGFASIIVIIDMFSKYATFILASTHCPTKETTKLFMTNIVVLGYTWKHSQ